MKKKELKSLREKTLTDLEKFIKDKNKELSDFYSNLKSGKEKNSSRGKALRREIAQGLTFIKEAQIKLKLS